MNHNFTKVILTAAVFLTAPQAVSQDVVEKPDGWFGITFNSSRPVSEDYMGNLRELFKMANYGIDPLDMQGCNWPDLKSFADRAYLQPELKARADDEIREMSADGLWDFVNAISMWKTDLIVRPDISGASNEGDMAEWAKTMALQDALITYVILEAAKRGHSDALNEVGASQLYCYQGTRQDIPAAVRALTRASEQGDARSKMSLGKIYSSGLGGYADVAKGKRLEDEAYELVMDELRELRRESSKGK